MSSATAYAIRDRRERLGLTQLELATVAALSRGTIRNAEEGRPLEPRSEERLLHAVGCTRIGSGEAVIVVSEESARSIARVIVDAANDDADSRALQSLRDAYFALVARLAGGGAAFSATERRQLGDLLTLLPLRALHVVVTEVELRRPDLDLPDILADANAALSGSIQPRESAVHSGAEPSEGAESPERRPSSRDKDFVDEVASHVGDTDITLRRLGEDIGVGLVQVKANIPVTSTHVRWLTEDDLEVIAQTVETQVVQMTKSLAHARSRMFDHVNDLRGSREFREFQARARRDWYRTVVLVRKFVEEGGSIDEIAEKLGDTREAVEEMLNADRTEAP